MLINILDSHTHHEKVGSIRSCIFGIDQIPHQYFTIGIHPNFSASFNDFSEFIFKNRNNPNLVGIGEIGFDKNSSLSPSKQYELFKNQVNLATQLNKPCVVHLTGLYDSFFNYLKINKNQAKFLIHGFNKHIQLLDDFLKFGLLISINHNMLKRHNFLSYFEKLWPDRLFIETDNYPIEINDILNQLSQLTGIQTDILKESISRNNQNFFNIKT